MTHKNTATADLLATVDPGEGRWWKVELVKNVASKPIKITLMQSFTPGRTALSEAIGHTRTNASPEAVREAADLVLAQVGDYANVIGQYGIKEAAPVPTAVSVPVPAVTNNVWVA
jgi:hypothetical protein